MHEEDAAHHLLRCSLSISSHFADPWSDVENLLDMLDDIFVDAMNLAVKQLALLAYTQGYNQLLLAGCDLSIRPHHIDMCHCVWADVEGVADMLDYIIKDSKNFAVKLTVPMPMHKVAAHHSAQCSLSWCGMFSRLERNIAEKAAFLFFYNLHPVERCTDRIISQFHLICCCCQKRVGYNFVITR